MAPDNERAWREPVRAARLALARLEAPAPFNDLTAPEKILADLSQPLPLVDFSPFETFRDGQGEIRSEPPFSSVGTAVRSREPGVEDANTWLSDLRTRASGTPRVSREAPLIAASGSGDPDVRPPAFSFRRSEDSGHPAGLSHTSRTPRSPQADKTTFSPPGFSFRQADTSEVPAGGPEVPRTSVASEDGPDAGPVHGTSSVPGPSRESDRLRLRSELDSLESGSAALEAMTRPGSLLNSLAEDALEALGWRRPADSTRRPADLSDLSAFDEQAEDSRVPGANDHGGTSPPGTLAEPLTAPGASATTSLPRLPRTSIVGSRLPPAGEASEATGPIQGSFAELGPAHEPDRWSQPVTSWAVNADPEAGMDADAYAALVNDALLRQARRHGVDLS